MKKQLFAVVGVACTLAACSEVLEEAPEVKGEGVYATLEQPTSIDTRSFTYENNKLVFTWGDGENLMAIGDGDAALFRTVNAGESSSKLESKGFQLMDGITYYAYIPAKSLPTSETEIPVSLLGQRQTENNSSAHLKDYDYACTTATKDEGSNSLNFNLENQIGWIILEHTFAENVNNVTSVTISATDDIFTTEGTLDVATSTLTGETTESQITLDLGKKGGDGLSFTAGELFRGFFTIAPVDLSGKTLTITATTKDGSTIELGTFTKETASIAKSKFGIINTSGSTAEPVAAVDGNKYSTVSAAMAAAAQTSGTKTITLLGDVKENVVLNDTRKNNSGGLYTTILDMAGHSITAETGNAITVKSGELSVKNGTINSTKSTGVIFDPEADGAKVTLWGCTVNAQEGAVATSTASNSSIRIVGGTYTAADNAVILGNGNTNHLKKVDGKTTDTGVAREKANRITIESSTTYGVPVFNGKIQSSGYVACGIYAPWKDIITVNAGIFNIENGVGILSRGGTVTINDAEIATTEPNDGYVGMVGDSRVVVPCKTMFIDRECGYSDVENATIIIKGGKYSDNAGVDYVPDGYVYAETGDTPLAYEIVVGGDKLIEAINNVAEGGTVTVDYYASLKNKPAAIKKNFNLEVAENAVITAGYSNYSNTLNYCLDNGNSTITGNGTIEGPKAASSAAIWIGGENQTLTIDGNVTIKGGESTNTNNDNATAVNIYNGKLVINNGTFISGTDATGNNSPAIYLTPRVGEIAELEINGGVFKSVSGNAEFLINCADDATSRCKISIKGGTFYGFNPADNNADGAHTNYVDEGYRVIQDGDTYTVVEYTAQDKLNDEIKGAAKGEPATVTLPSDANLTLDNGIANEGDKSRNITFVGDGTQTIDVVANAVGAEGGRLNYQRGSSFTFKNVTIQAGTGTYDGIVCDELTYENCTIKGKLTLYGKATFIGCTFENDMDNQYSIWTWGGTDVKFEDCTFNTNGKAILLYGQATAAKPTNLSVTNCTFNDRNNGSAGKAAIEIGNDYNATYNLTVSGCTVNGFAEGKNTGSTLWANKNSMDAEHLSVTIDGVKVF